MCIFTVAEVIKPKTYFAVNFRCGIQVSILFCLWLIYSTSAISRRLKVSRHNSVVLQPYMSDIFQAAGHEIAFMGITQCFMQWSLSVYASLFTCALTSMLVYMMYVLVAYILA